MPKKVTPNEKVCEELFLMYAFMRVYRLKQKRMTIYAPTLKEENASGYDAKANVGCRELYIQFKRAEHNKHKNQLSFKIDSEQLDRLKSLYPFYSAFYVVGSFDDRTQLDNDQQKAKIPSFLNRYIAIPAHLIPNKAKKVSFCLDCHQNKYHDCIHTKLPHIDDKVFLTRDTPLKEWLFGDELLRDFMNDYSGATIRNYRGKLIRVSSPYIREIGDNQIQDNNTSIEIDEDNESLQGSNEYAPTRFRLC